MSPLTSIVGSLAGFLKEGNVRSGSSQPPNNLLLASIGHPMDLPVKG